MTTAAANVRLGHDIRDECVVNFLDTDDQRVITPFLRNDRTENCIVNSDHIDLFETDPFEDEQEEEDEEAQFDDRDDISDRCSSESSDAREVVVKLRPRRNASVRRLISTVDYYRGEARKKSAWRRCGHSLKVLYLKLGLKHLVPVLLLTLYSLLGAGVFYAIESPYEKAVYDNDQRELKYAKKQLEERIWELRVDPKLTYPKVINYARAALFWYENKTKSLMVTDPQWDFWGAIFYCGTIYTTIGYGNITPRTFSGQLLTLFYAAFGIPLVFFILNDLGDVLGRGIYRIWTRLKKISCLRRKQGRLADYDATDEEADAASTSDTTTAEFANVHDLPMSIALGITLGWMFLCSAIFCTWENWDYFKAFHFFFVSLTTVGLGDTVPKHHNYMIMSFGLVLLGLSLVSMCIQVVQAKIEHLAQKMLEKILKRYKDAQLEGETMSLRPDLERTFDEALAPSWLRALLPRRKKARLVEEWKKRAKMRVNCTQTEDNIKKTVSVGFQTDPVTDWQKTYEKKLAAAQSLLADLEERYSALLASSSQQKHKHGNRGKSILFRRLKTPVSLSENNTPTGTPPLSRMASLRQKLSFRRGEKKSPVDAASNTNSGTTVLEPDGVICEEVIEVDTMSVTTQTNDILVEHEETQITPLASSPSDLCYAASIVSVIEVGTMTAEQQTTAEKPLVTVVVAETQTVESIPDMEPDIQSIPIPIHISIPIVKYVEPFEPEPISEFLVEREIVSELTLIPETARSPKTVFVSIPVSTVLGASRTVEQEPIPESILHPLPEEEMATKHEQMQTDENGNQTHEKGCCTDEILRIHACTSTPTPSVLDASTLAAIVPDLSLTISKLDIPHIPKSNSFSLSVDRIHLPTRPKIDTSTSTSDFCSPPPLHKPLQTTTVIVVEEQTEETKKENKNSVLTRWIRRLLPGAPRVTKVCAATQTARFKSLHRHHAFLRPNYDGRVKKSVSTWRSLEYRDAACSPFPPLPLHIDQSQQITLPPKQTVPVQTSTSSVFPDTQSTEKPLESKNVQTSTVFYLGTPETSTFNESSSDSDSEKASFIRVPYALDECKLLFNEIKRRLQDCQGIVSGLGEHEHTSKQSTSTI